jgi:hypothetical protein
MALVFEKEKGKLKDISSFKEAREAIFRNQKGQIVVLVGLQPYDDHLSMVSRMACCGVTGIEDKLNTKNWMFLDKGDVSKPPIPVVRVGYALACQEHMRILDYKDGIAVGCLDINWVNN